MTDGAAPEPDVDAAATGGNHARPIDDVFEQLKTTSSGLSQDEAKARLEAWGANRLPEPPRRSILLRFLLQFHNILIYVLLAAAVVTAFLDHLIDTAVILAVVIVNAVIGLVQEGKAEKAMDAIRQMLAPRASVLRDGARCSVEGEALVPGDVVLLEAGDKVPADLRLLQAHGMSVQEAILTGESVPVEKQTGALTADLPLGDRSNMAYSGTLVTSGQGRGVVTATGSATEIGRISGLLSTVDTLTTPLVNQMNVFGKCLTALILVVGALLFGFGYLVAGFSFDEIFMVVVGLSVAAIPEGLPAVLTITLAIGVQAMARRNAIVRRLPAIETLGSVSVICTDKTGTLTRNEMAVASALSSAHLFRIGGSGYEPKGTISLDNTEVSSADHSILEELARSSALCNDAALREHEGSWVVEGDPMEGALLAFCGKAGLDVRGELSRWTRTDAIPFDASHRYMATLNHDHDDHAYIFVKGAPEQVLTMCRDQRGPAGATEALNTAYWQSRAEEIASLGQRVLALALRTVEPGQTVLEHSDVEGTLTLLGMVGMIDPPRPEAIEAVAECHQAGIRVKMITGDHAGTAMAIGREIALQNPASVLTGRDIDAMDDAALQAVVQDCDIFARTSPEHKLRLVMALQAHNLTVAMTGDGVNDAPALKRADTGIAMGQKGSEAAKEASELVLADDNFASIVAAIRQGRTVYDNLKKVITWTLPTNAGESLTIIVALLFGMTLPVTPIQILWINLITAVTLGIALAFEPTEENTMRRPPRGRTESLLSGTLVWQIVLASLLFVCGVFGVYNYAIEQDYSLELARTMVVNMIVIMEIFYLFFVRNIYGTSLTWQAVRGTGMVWLTVGIVTAAQFAITYLPFLQRVFATEPVAFRDGLLLCATGAVLLAILETEKQIRLRWLAGRRAALPTPE
ncbi:cation-transporting P-type ATPase [Kineobactrum salinum]|uniref:Cation-transporting P-type ATPase n=1 Tax=Kineobactrum salinum TaxID=2708301 RepID=A0A6C0U3B4_9GAMM|nr:cation-transporting P-type ATPase [Kineobactrum salinum]QIB64855.1 cation-transporting P-type ATPase [Kineobactrum salinum]